MSASPIRTSTSVFRLHVLHISKDGRAEFRHSPTEGQNQSYPESLLQVVELISPNHSKISSNLRRSFAPSVPPGSAIKLIRPVDPAD